MNTKTKFFSLTVLAILIFGSLQSYIAYASENAVAATSIFVATSGSDSSGNGSIDNPYGSIEKAAREANPGDTVYVRGGVYNVGEQSIGADGTDTQRITIKPYNNEEVVLDADGKNLAENEGIIALTSAKYVTVEGFEMRNSTGRGITIYESEHIIIRNNYVHHIGTRAIGGAGADILIEGNHVYEAVLENEDNKYNATGGWAGAVATWTRSNGDPSTDIVIRNNIVENVWGEGIMALRSIGMVVEGNTVINPYSVGIYLNKLENAIVNGNHVYITDTRFNRSDRSYPAHGINIANENARSTLPRSNNIILSNNLIVGTGAGIRYWHDTRGGYEDNNYRDFQVVNNVIIGTHKQPIDFEDVPSDYVQPTNATLHNNIIFRGLNGDKGNIGDLSAWTISHNNWPDGIPSFAQEANSFSADPMFVNPDFLGDATGFQLQEGSSSIGRGTSINDVPADFWGNAHASQPSLGIHEGAAGTVNPNPTPNPTPNPGEGTTNRAPGLYVATNGSDSTGNGSWENPYRTIEKAASKASAGQTVYVRGGTYTQVMQTVKANGTSNDWITIRPYENEQVILDGEGAGISESKSIINISDSSYVIFQGFEVRNSTGRGISVYESEHIIIRDNKVHDVQTRGIGGSGHYLTFEGNEVWNAVRQNESKNMNGGWAAGMSTWTLSDGSLSTNIIIRNNLVHDTWGEGIIALLADNVQIENNTVYDTYSVNIYVDNATNVNINSNYLYSTGSTYNRNDRSYPATGINLANEQYGTSNPLHDITISNNLIIGTGRGINFWQDSNNSNYENSYQNVTIVYNVIKDTHSHALKFSEVSSNFRSPSNALLQNNIIYTGLDGNSIDLGNQSTWVILHNNWPDDNPMFARDASNFSTDPMFVNPVVGGPRDGFHLQDGSPNIGRGIPVAGVDYDYRGIPRGAEQTTIGIYEPFNATNQVFMPIVGK